MSTPIEAECSFYAGRSMKRFDLVRDVGWIEAERGEWVRYEDVAAALAAAEAPPEKVVPPADVDEEDEPIHLSPYQARQFDKQKASPSCHACGSPIVLGEPVAVYHEQCERNRGAATEGPPAERWPWRPLETDPPDGAGGQVWVAYPNPNHPNGWNVRVQWTPVRPELLSRPIYWKGIEEDPGVPPKEQL